jgi:IS30 family transposase
VISVVRSASMPALFRGVATAHGGIAPARRRRSHLVLTFAERGEISRGLASGASIRQIAASLGRALSTIGREITRHGTRRTYRAAVADERAWERARRPKQCWLATHLPLQQVVAEKLALD